MAQDKREVGRRLIDEALGRTYDPSSIDLRRKLRIHEAVIQALLFLCGLLSILTTVGIVGVLLSQSLQFFNQVSWDETQRTIAEPIDAEQTILRLSDSGGSIGERLMRAEGEWMEVVEFLPNAITVQETGTGGGFRDFFCVGETDINDASRAITDEERQLCTTNDVTPLEFRVGTDAIAITLNAENDFATDLTMAEVRQIFSEATLWSDVRDDWPQEEIVRFIPGEDSGTFDFFAETIFEEDGETALLAMDPVTSEDDEQLTRGISQNEFAVGFFGYAYYVNNQENFSLVTLDGVAPSADTVDEGSYALSRPLFIYVNEQALRERDEVAAFVNFYLQNVDDVIESVGYFPESQEDLDAAQATLADIIGDDGVLPQVDFSDIHGNINIAGSSTVAPLTTRIAADFRTAGFLPEVEVIRGVNEEFPAVEHAAGTHIERGEQATLWEFITNTAWQPRIFDFGIFPLIYGTLATSVIAMLVALPLGLGAAIYLSEYAQPRVRATLKPILEILAGIPTVVYGYFALNFMTPLLRSLLGVETVAIFNSASAGIVVGILIIPLVASMSEDALRAVPRALREASYGLGANKQETTLNVVLPAATSGIVAAFIVAISRAVGETMVVAIAAGAGPFNNLGEVFSQRGLGVIFQSAETMTGHIARISGGDLSYQSVDYNSIFAIGLTLFIITFILNVLSRIIINRFREAY